MIDIKKITRCFRKADNSIVKVKRFNFMYQRLNIYLIGFALLVAYTYTNLSDTAYIKKRNLVVNTEEVLKEQFSFWKETYNDYSEYYKEIRPKVRNSYFLIVGFTFITLLPWIIYIIWRQAAPICIDRKRQLIYTWHRGKLYAARLKQLQPELKDKSTYLEFGGGWGPMIISLYPAGEVYDKSGNLNKGKRIPIGTFIPQYNYQNHDLKPFIENYMAGYINIPDDIESSKSWLEYAPRKPKELPSHETLNKVIKHWLEKEQNK